MQFVILARDGNDPDALSRRMAARPAHIELGDRMRGEGRHLMAAALTDDNEKMVGSVLVVDFPSRAALEQWLAIEPYVTGKVWQHIEILPCKVGPSFSRPT